MVPKRSLGGQHLGGSSAHNRREVLKKDKKAEKLAIKIAAAEKRHAQNFEALNKWIAEMRPFCKLYVQELRKERPTVHDIVQAVAISRWYKGKVTKALKGCKGHSLSKKERELVNERFEIPLMHALMHAPEFRGNKKTIEAQIAKAISKFNQELG